MSSNKFPLNEFITLQRGFDLPKGDREYGEVPVVASTGVSGFHSESKAEAPGVVIGRSGSIGGGQYITHDFWPLNTTLWVKDFKGHDPRYIYYLLKSIDFSSFNAGAAVPTLNRNHLSAIMVSNVGIDRERKISHLLGTIDDKIALNQQMNKTLEEVAQAIFKCWFVDFEPVKAKMAGESEESICNRLNLTPDILHLFPDTLTDSPLGPIPIGWSIGSLLDLVNIWSGGTPKTKVEEYWNGHIPWFSVVDAPRDGDVFVIDTEKAITDEGVNNSATKVLPVGTTIVSARGTVGKLALTGVPMAMNQSCYGLEGKIEIGPYYNYLNLQQLVAGMKDMAHGSVFDTITRKTLEGIDVVRPSNDTMAMFNDSVESMFLKIRSNLLENKALSEARDTLLPKLLSGELSVDDVKLEID